MVHLIVGYGEVGSSLGKVLGKHLFFDPQKESTYKKNIIPDVVHICVPYINKRQFDKVIRDWDFGGLIIVHSSVPVGTCDRLGVVHSPITGVHPYLAEGIKTFVKYFGGKSAEKAATVFKKLGIKTKVYDEARVTEAMKLWSTTQYGRMIMLEKEIYEWCQKNDLPFEEIYTRSNKEYNEGYVKLGMPQVVRPYLKHIPGPIGGHCVNENCKLLGVGLK